MNSVQTTQEIASGSVATLWRWNHSTDEWRPDPEWQRKPSDTVWDRYQELLDQGLQRTALMVDYIMHEFPTERG